MNKRQISEKDKHGYMILAGVLVFIVISVIVAIFLIKEPYSCDDNHLKAHTMIIIDTTDPVTEGQQKRIRELVGNIKNGIKTDEKFSIYILETKLNGLSYPLFSACQPPKGSDANPFYQNRRKYEKRYNDSYEKLFKEVLPSIALGGQGDRSPIMEALVEVGQRPDFSKKVADRRLVFISDLIQNTENYSFFDKKALTVDKLLQTISTKGLVPNLSGVKVELHIIQRDNDKNKQLQGGDSFTKFWVQYFNNAGAQVVMITKRF